MESSDRDIQFELKERLPFQNILAEKLKRLSDFISNSEIPFKDVQAGILDLLTDIPDSWKDNEFEAEMKKVIKERNRDIRPSYAGRKLSYKYCEERRIPTIATIKEINYFSLKNAIINLLDRRQLLISKEKIELTTGRNLDYETLEEYEKMFKDDTEL